MILVMLLGQSRVFYSMSRDGLLPKLFCDVHPKFRTPGARISVYVRDRAARAFAPIRSWARPPASALCSRSCWSAAELYHAPDLSGSPGPFKTPFVPVVPILGSGLTCS